MRGTAAGVVSGLVVLVTGLVLGGCAAPRQSAAAPPPPPPVTTPTTTTAPPTQTSTPEPPPCPATAVACVRLSTAQAWLRPKDGAAVGPVPISYGVGAHATPVGTFHVAWKAEHWISTEYHEPMPDAVFFAVGGIAFHAGSLVVRSHGCVHLAPDVAARFFAVLQDGDEVQVLP